MKKTCSVITHVDRYDQKHYCTNKVTATLLGMDVYYCEEHYQRNIQEEWHKKEEYVLLEKECCLSKVD